MTKLVLLGGFLGAGKTTFLIKAAQLLENRGFSVSVVTNDQGDTLVDTLFSRVKGLDAHEVSGGCFCCRFPDFLETLESVIAQSNPDYVIAEAVGSCTDIAATVINPLKDFHSKTIEVKAYLTLVDGLSLQEENRKMDLLHPLMPGEVLFSHQIRESEVLVLSKTDLLKMDQQSRSVDFLKTLNGRARIFPCSSRNCEGMEDLLNHCIEGFPLDFSDRVFIDYQVYAEAEAAYGWYNGSWYLDCLEKMNPMDVSFSIMESFRNPLLGDVAHAKLLITTSEGGLKVSFVMGHIQADEVGLEDQTFHRMKIVLNVRSACTPEMIEKHVLSLQETLKEEGMIVQDYSWNSLIPSPPRPYYS